MIGLAAKSLDEVEAATQEKNRFKVRRKFWTELLKSATVKTPRFQSISPGNQSWIGAGSGLRGVPFNFVAGKNYGRAELYIDRGDKEENKEIFGDLFSQKATIEQAFGRALTWERLDDARASRVKSETPGNIFDDRQWPALITFMTDAMACLDSSLKRASVADLSKSSDPNLMRISNVQRAGPRTVRA